ncbi:MAG: ABC transporter permease [Bacteroidales bacterium]|jgi:peptide/nickel transport system permease protein|nr:ABC transporter permease [Bacteroidales bacterium]
MALFKKSANSYKAVSLSALTWARFKRESQGMISLFFILAVSIIALLGYLITPDSSPDCNRQQLEISLQKPGFSVQMLQLKPSWKAQKVSWWRKMLFGQPDLYRYVPVASFWQQGDTLCVVPFGQSEAQGERYALSELCSEQPVVGRTFWLGTDRYGRDVLSQLLMGSRVSLAVGLISVFIALLIGIFIGSVAGFYRGRIDDVLMWLVNVVWSIPTLLLVIAISFALGRGFWQIFIAIGLTTWVDVARIVRGQVISLRETEFVEAGRVLGYSNFHIIFRHIIPNVLGTVSVVAASNFSSAILMEAGLSFLGIGVQPPTPSWGTMIKENYSTIVLDNAYLAITPGIAIMLLVLSFMLISSALRNAMDVRG